MRTRNVEKHVQKIARNKTLKIKCSSKYKHSQLVQNILREWKIQTNGGGNIKRDNTTMYKCDYYLSLTNVHNRNTHIHLIIHNFYRNSCTLNGSQFVRKSNNIIGYCIKKHSNHSTPVTININQSPKFIVSTMLKQIKNFK